MILSVAAHAGELYTMANLAARLIGNQPAVRMAIGESLRMTRRLQLGFGSVAVLAAERRIDASVTDQAVRHSREMRFGGEIRLKNAAMTGETSIVRRQMLPHSLDRAEIPAAGYGRIEHGCDVAESQMILVVESKGPLRRRTIPDGSGIRVAEGAIFRRSLAVVADQARLFPGEIVIGCLSALRNWGVAREAARSCTGEVLFV
jgi:hypothetical protein